VPLNPLGLYRLKLVGELHGQATETTFHFQTSSFSSETSYTVELDRTMDTFISTVLPKIQAFANQEWAAKTVIGVSLIPKQALFIEKRLANGAGFQGDNSLPSFCAGLLSLRTGVGGRSSIGRLYLPGVAELLSSASRLEGAYLSLLSNVGATLVSTFGPSGSWPYTRWGVFSRKLGVTRTLLPTPTLTYSHAGFKIVTNTVARPEIATMRRRKLARGI
jgi:hypothetical protein